MSRDEFTKLFSFIQDMKHGIDRQFADVYKRFDDVNTRLDEHYKLIIDVKDELAALTSQVNRHDSWINKLSDNASTKLDIQAQD